MSRAWMAAGLLAMLAMRGVCAGDSDPPTSVYQLEARLTDQSGKPVRFDAYRGHPVLVTMFYASCRATCPLIIDTLRVTERAVPEQRRPDLRVLMISFDPKRDTPAALANLAKERRIDPARWTLATTDPDTVRTLAALLQVQYREMPGGEFSHSSAIVLLSPHGEILARTAELGHADPGILQALTR